MSLHVLHSWEVFCRRPEETRAKLKFPIWFSRSRFKVISRSWRVNFQAVTKWKWRQIIIDGGAGRELYFFPISKYNNRSNNANNNMDCDVNYRYKKRCWCSDCESPYTNPTLNMCLLQWAGDWLCIYGSLSDCIKSHTSPKPVRHLYTHLWTANHFHSLSQILHKTFTNTLSNIMQCVMLTTLTQFVFWINCLTQTSTFIHPVCYKMFPAALTGLDSRSRCSGTNCTESLPNWLNWLLGKREWWTQQKILYFSYS